MANILIAYYSRKGQNYWNGSIKNLAKGNTEVVAEMIQKTVGGDLFEIETVKEYPVDYTECTEVAKEELRVKARPELKKMPESIDAYDVIFLGYPCWWSDLPMAVYTFLENNDFNGKTIIPFCTSAGSYMTGKESRITGHAKGATVLNKGLGLPGRMSQDNPKAVKSEVEKWLKEIGYAK